LKANARTGLLIEELLICDDLCRIGATLGAGENDSSNRLLGSAASGTGNTRDRDRNIRIRSG